MTCLESLNQGWTDFHSRCAAAVTETNEVAQKLYEFAGEVCTDIGKCLDRHYTQLTLGVVELTTTHFGEETATFVLKALIVIRDVSIRTFQAAPVTLATLFLPSWLVGPIGLLSLGYTLVHFAYEKPFSNGVYDILNTGRGNAYSVRAAVSAVNFFTSGNPAWALGGLINLAVAGFFYARVPATDGPTGLDKEGCCNRNSSGLLQTMERPLLGDDNGAEDVTSSSDDDNVDDAGLIRELPSLSEVPSDTLHSVDVQ
ncbi:MAG: hypothetical protein JSR46_11100 [Verrucomicrobia bacterium]|nr:hypothetical protein [Verrucomicrobiota bacterium]